MSTPLFPSVIGHNVLDGGTDAQDGNNYPGPLLQDYAAAVVGAGVAYGRTSGTERLLGLGAGQAATSGTTIVGQIPALGPYYGLRAHYINYDSSEYTVSLAKTAAAPTHQHTGFGLDWKTITVAGDSTDIVIPVAVSGATVDAVPSIVSTDVIYCPSVARTDDPTKKRLQQFRSYSAGAQWALGLTGGFLAALNSDVAANGRQFASRTPAGDQVTTIANNATSQPLEAGGFFNPWHIEFFYESPVQLVAFCGDSLTRGQGSETGAVTHGNLGFPQRACDQVTNAGRKVISCLNMGVSGQYHAASMATARAVITAFKPDRIVLFAWSPNDGAATDAVMLACRADLLRTLEDARRAGVRRTVCTSGPVSSYDAAADSRLKAQNAWVRLLCASGIAELADIAPILEDPADRANILPAYAADGTHYNAAGYAAIAPTVAATF